jgi:hypothetical protein
MLALPRAGSRPLASACSAANSSTHGFDPGAVRWWSVTDSPLRSTSTPAGAVASARSATSATTARHGAASGSSTTSPFPSPATCSRP